MRAGYVAAIFAIAAPAAVAGCAARAAHKSPTGAPQAPIREPPLEVFDEDKTGDVKAQAIDTLTRIIRWHNRRLTAMGPLDDKYLYRKPVVAKSPPVTGGVRAPVTRGASTPPRAEAGGPKPAARPKPAEAGRQTPATPAPGAATSPPPTPARRRLSVRYYSRYEVRYKKKRTAWYRCVRARKHAQAICRAATKICRLADQLDEEPARQRCTWAQKQCRIARKRAVTVCKSG